MIHKRTVTKEVQEIENILCDLCGKSTKMEKYSGPDSLFEFSTFRFQGGYYGNYDGLSFELHICESCALDMFKRRIRPEGELEIPDSAWWP